METEIRQKAMDLVEKLPQERLVEAVELLESLFKNDRVTGEETPSQAEIELLKIVRRRLPPEEEARLEELDDRNEWSELSEAEYNELLTGIERVEHQNVQRVAALMELAKIRKVDLVTKDERSPYTG